MVPRALIALGIAVLAAIASVAAPAAASDPPTTPPPPPWAAVAVAVAVDDVTSPPVGPTASDSTSAAFAAVQGDCGWATCTVRLDRAKTRWLANWSGSLGGAATAICATTSGPAAVACIAGINAVGWTIQNQARGYYRNGNCWGLRFPRPPVPGLPHSTEVTRGTHNCR